MAQFFQIHPDNPQQRLIQQAVAIIDRGGLVVYPTDSSYALGCHIGDKTAMERIQRLRRTDKHHHFTLVVYPTDSSYALGCHIGDKTAMERIQRLRRTDKHHHFTLVCSDLSEIGTYAKVGNSEYRLMRNLTPGPYTFLLKATSVVPRRLMNPKRKTIGVRVPDNNIVQALLQTLGQPIMSSTMIPPGKQNPMGDPEEIRERFEHEVDLVIDGGFCGIDPTTVVNLIDGYPEVVRQGKGDAAIFAEI